MTADVFMESGALGTPAVVIHGGAGDYVQPRSQDQLARLSEAMSDALQAAWDVLEVGGHALDAVIEAVALHGSFRHLQLWAGCGRHCAGHRRDRRGCHGRRNREFRGNLCRYVAREPRASGAGVLALGGPRHGPVLLAGAGADRFSQSRGSRQDGSRPCCAARASGRYRAAGPWVRWQSTLTAISPLPRRPAGVSASCRGEWVTRRSPERERGQTMAASRSPRPARASRFLWPVSPTGSTGASRRERHSKVRSGTRSGPFVGGVGMAVPSRWRAMAVSLSPSTRPPWLGPGAGRQALGSRRRSGTLSERQVLGLKR